MGLAASQARYLSLVARESNLEYQGQQINQSRTILAQQVSDLYNTLLSLEVPTPPNVSDYTKITYSGTDGASQFTLGTVLPSTKKTGTYNVELKTETTGPSLSTQYNKGVVKTKTEEIPCSAPATGETQTTSITDYYIRQSDGTIRKAQAADFTVDSTGSAPVYIFKAGVNYLVKDESSLSTYTYSETTVAGQEVMSFKEAEERYPNYVNWDEYKSAIKNSFTSTDGTQTVTEDNFSVYFTTSSTGVSEPHLVLTKEVEAGGQATIYDYATGTYTKSEQRDECELEFDSSGRIVAINLPVYEEGSTDPIMYNRITLTAEETTDTDAYNEAYNQYTYETYQYDQKNNEINAKTELIQTQDKNLELKLTRLDSEREMISKELESVKKVLDDNIEKSFKTFSG